MIFWIDTLVRLIQVKILCASSVTSQHVVHVIKIGIVYAGQCLCNLDNDVDLINTLNII